MLLFPSVCEETYGYAVVESALLGTLSLASRVGGVQEMLEGTVAEGFTYRLGDTAGLLAAIEAVTRLDHKTVEVIGEKLRGEVLQRLDGAKMAERVRRAPHGD